MTEKEDNVQDTPFDDVGFRHESGGIVYFIKEKKTEVKKKKDNLLKDIKKLLEDI